MWLALKVLLIAFLAPNSAVAFMAPAFHGGALGAFAAGCGRRAIVLRVGGGATRINRGSQAPPPEKKNVLTINEDIRHDPVRVIVDKPGGQDEQKGIMSLEEVCRLQHASRRASILTSRPFVPLTKFAVGKGGTTRFGACVPKP